MPCYVQETQEEKDACAYERFAHNSPLAEWLCTLFKVAPAWMETNLPDEAILWWEDHKLRDKEKAK